MNDDLTRASKELGIEGNEVEEIADAPKAPGWLVLALVGILAAVISFIVGFAFPAPKNDQSDGYPFSSLATASLVAAPLSAMSRRTRFFVALPALVVVSMLSFAFGALFNDAFFGFGTTYSVCAKDQLKAKNQDWLLVKGVDR